MRILSLNVWCGTMWEQLAAWLPTVEADVLCLQEVVRSPELAGWVHYDDGEHAQSQRADLFADLARLLPRHQGSFVAHDGGPVRVDGHVHRQLFGMALFVADHLPIVGQMTAPVHGTFIDHADAWPASGRPRLAQSVRIADRADARTLTIAHTHGLRDGRGKGDTPDRILQAQRLRDLVAATRAPDDLTVVAGDLNVLPDSGTFAVLGELGLVDLVGTTSTRTSRYPKPVPHADYLLVSDRDAVKGFTVVEDPEVSDHRPLLLEL